MTGESREACLKNWPEAENMAYHPSCCRFPKSCSIEDPPERGGEIKPFEYTEDSIPVQLSEGGPVPIEVQGHVIELTTTPVSLSPPVEGDDLGAPLALLLQHHPDANTQKHVSFWEDEPWDQHTEMFMVTMSRAAWEAQGSPANVWVSMATISATTPEKEN